MHEPLAIRDEIEFNALALNLVKFGEYSIRIGHPSSFRAPGFPLWVAALYSISYENYFLVYVGQCLLGAVGCLLAYLLAKELLPEVDARRSGLLAVVYMPAIFLCTLFFSDTLYADCLALGMLLFVRYLRTRRSAWLVIAGLSLGYGALTRPAGILVLPALLTILVAGMIRARRFRLLPCLALALSCFAVVAPWTWRNYIVHHQFVLIATNGGWTFYGSNNNVVLHNRAYLGRFVPPYVLQGRAKIDAMPDEVSLDRLEWRLGIGWVRAHWASMPLLETYKFVRLWLPTDPINRRFPAAESEFVLMRAVGYLPFLVLFLLGFRRCALDRRFWTWPWLSLHVTVLALIATALVFNGDPRYRDGQYTTLMPYAALGLMKRPVTGKSADERS
ncbi:MAG: ArnT family glycosyltransferase [Bryobacteraceae bacterium]